MKKNVFVQTANVKEFVSVAGRLNRVEAGVPGMGLVHGVKGLGKTSAAINFASQKANRTVYVRAKRDWSYAWMMDELLIEMSVTPLRGDKAKFDALVEALVDAPRLVIVDETNLVPVRLLETIRGLHDMTHNPFLFVGHEGINNVLLRLGPFHDRLIYKTELKPLSLADLQTFCTEALEVGIDSEALAAVLKAADGNFRRSVVHLKALEDKAKLGNIQCITAATLKGVL